MSKKRRQSKVEEESRSKVEKVHHFSLRTLFKYTVILGTLFSFIFLVAFWSMIEARPQHVLENFRDQDLIATLKWLQERELKPVVYEKLDSEVDRFRIISQNPEPGILVKEGRAVTLVVSIGTKLEVMGDFIATDFSSARKQIYTQLAGEHRIPHIVKIERFSETYEEGLIIDQIPRPEERIDLEKDIVFFVSRGIVTESVQVNDYRMELYQEVYEMLSEAGINVQARFLTTTDSRRVGRIFEQDVAPGVRLIQGDEIQFVVAVRSDEVIESVSEINLEKLRILQMRVPFPVSSLSEVDVAVTIKEPVDQLASFCPCLEDSKIYEEEEEPTSTPSQDELEETTSGEPILRNIEIVVTDNAATERKFVYPNILAGRSVALPYRTIGSGNLTVYLDGEFYRSETFYDE